MAGRMPNLSRLQRQAYRSLQQGELDRTERLCGGILEHRPEDFDALHLLGMVHFQRQRMVEALRFLAHAPMQVENLSASGTLPIMALPPARLYFCRIARHPTHFYCAATTRPFNDDMIVA